MAILIDHETTRRHARFEGQDIAALRPRRSTSAGFRWLSLTIALAMLLPASGSLRAQPSGSTEYLLKAAFLYNIAKFVEWPATPSSDTHAPLTFCTVGEAFDGAIESVEGKQVQGHPIAIKRDPSIQSAKDCHLLFISETALGKSAILLDAVKDSPVLTVCDIRRCTDRGFMVNLQLTDNKVAIEINVEAVQHSRIKVSSQLMKLARLVKDER